jgi:hypothetical protein
MIMTARKLTAAFAAVLLVPAVLAGCSAPGAGPGGGNTGDNGAATSGPAPEDGDTGGEVSLPATFPTGDIPLIEGDLVYAQDLGTGWVIYIHSDDFNAGYEDAKGLLLDAGFTGDTVNQDDTGSFGQFTSDSYTVNLSSGDGADLGVGLSVGYTVVKN